MKFFYSAHAAIQTNYERKIRFCRSKDVHHATMKNMQELWYHPSGTFWRWFKNMDLCHMCSYKKNNVIFGFLKTMKLCHTVSTFALGLLPMKIIQDFSKFQHSPMMLDFTYKIWNLLEKVMLCFYSYFAVGNYKLVENRSVSQPWLPFWGFWSILSSSHCFQESESQFFFDMSTYGTKSIFFNQL